MSAIPQFAPQRFHSQKAPAPKPLPGVSGWDFHADSAERASPQDLVKYRCRPRAHRSRGFPNHIYQELYNTACSHALDAYLALVDIAFMSPPELYALNNRLYDAFRTASEVGAAGGDFDAAIDALEDVLGEVDVAIDPVNADLDFQLSSDSPDPEWCQCEQSVSDAWRALYTAAQQIRSAGSFRIPFLS